MIKYLQLYLLYLNYNKFKNNIKKGFKSNKLI